MPSGMHTRRHSTGLRFTSRTSISRSENARQRSNKSHVPQSSCRPGLRSEWLQVQAVPAGLHCQRIGSPDSPPNDSVHPVAAGGSSKIRKPAGRDTGATLCYPRFGNVRRSLEATSVQRIARANRIMTEAMIAGIGIAYSSGSSNRMTAFQFA